MKKINLLLFFLFVVIFSLIACGKQPEPEWVSEAQHYKLSDVDINLSIAVEVEKGQYLQADYRSKYGK